jgi:hypothetical protein
VVSGLLTLLGWKALRAKIVSAEAEDVDFGDSKARTTTKDEAIFAATRRDGADFPDFRAGRRWQTPDMRRSSLLELEKIGSRRHHSRSVNRP